MISPIIAPSKQSIRDFVMSARELLEEEYADSFTSCMYGYSLPSSGLPNNSITLIREQLNRLAEEMLTGEEPLNTIQKRIDLFCFGP